MDMKQSIERHLRALGAIVSLLLSLAGLAERAAGRSSPVRSFVLWLLYRAERVALGALFDEVEYGGAHVRPPPFLLHQGAYSPADAIRLAARLRMLAARMNLVLGQARRFARRSLGWAASAAVDLAEDLRPAADFQNIVCDLSSGRAGIAAVAPQLLDTS